MENVLWESLCPPGFCDYLFEINVVSMVLGEENQGGKFKQKYLKNNSLNKRQ